MELFSPSKDQLSASLSSDQLFNIKAQLDLVLMALESLLGLSSEAMLETAQSLGLKDLMGDRVALWRLRQSSPLRRGQGRKKLDVEEACGLVLVTAALAQQHQADIRRAVSLLEETTRRKQPPHRVALLGDYLDAFSNFYGERMVPDDGIAADHLRELALKLLVDLLFYSQTGGTRRLWLTLLDRAYQG